MPRLTMDQLRMVFGFIILFILALLAGVISLGHVEEKTSYGLSEIITALATLGGSFGQWAFGQRPSGVVDNPGHHVEPTAERPTPGIPPPAERP